MKSHKGFTLIEILAALAVLSIALTALMLANIEYTSNNRHLEDKMVAHWIGMNIAAEVRLGLKDPPEVSQQSTGFYEMADSHWTWTLNGYSTEDEDTVRVEVNVRKKDSTRTLTHVTAFIAQVSR